MARSDLTVFQKVSLEIGKEEHNLSTDVIKLGIVNNDVVPTAGQTDPKWVDFSAGEVSTGGGYVAGGIVLQNVTYTESGGIATLNSDDVALLQNAAGFTDGFWGIVYNSTNPTEKALTFIDLGGPVSEVASPIEFNWNALGIMALNVV